MISTLQLQIICITESHLLNHIKDSFLSIPHFNMYRSDAAGSTYKHGVCAYVHESLHVDTIETPMPNLLSFRLSSSNIHIVVVYRPPSNTSSVNTELVQHIYALCESREVILLGDFNLPALDWLPSGPLTTYPPLERSFLDVFDSLGLHQWVHDPTFPSSGNILDLVLTSEEDRIGQIQTLPPLPGSDHCPVVVEYIFSAHIPLLAQGPGRHAWNRGKYSRIRPILSGIDWCAEFEGLNTNDCFELLTTRVKSLTDEFVPLKLDRNSKPPWPSRPPSSLVRQRQRAWSTFKSVRHRLGNRSSEASIAYRTFATINNKYRNYNVYCQSKYEETLINRSKENPKLLHSYIRHKKVGRSSAGPLKLPSGALTDNDQSI